MAKGSSGRGGKSVSGGHGKGAMTQSAASRIQSATAKVNGGKVASGSFASRAQSAASTNSNTGKK